MWPNRTCHEKNKQTGKAKTCVYGHFQTRLSINQSGRERAAQMSRQVWHCLLKSESMWICGAARQNFQKLAKPSSVTVSGQRHAKLMNKGHCVCELVTSCAAGKTAFTWFAKTLPACEKTYRQRASPASAPKTHKPCNYIASPFCMHRIPTGDYVPTFGQLLAETSKVGLLEVPVEVWQHAHQIWHLRFSLILVYVHCLQHRKVWELPWVLTRK